VKVRPQIGQISINVGAAGTQSQVPVQLDASVNDDAGFINTIIQSVSAKVASQVSHGVTKIPYFGNGTLIHAPERKQTAEDLAISSDVEIALQTRAGTVQTIYRLTHVPPVSTIIVAIVPLVNDLRRRRRRDRQH
jgi:hypothetical protein